MTTDAHLNAFLSAMGRGDLAEAMSHCAEDVALSSPIVAEPFVGRARVAEVMTKVGKTLGGSPPSQLLRGERSCAIVRQLTVGAHRLDSVEYLHVNESGLVDSLKIHWRPLDAVVEAQLLIAPLLGIVARKLVPVAEGA